jgi:membrane fusion protein (multidrug efflux system)
VDVEVAVHGAGAELDLQNTTVKSPSDGVIMKRPSSPSQIVERIASPGEIVQAGNVLLLLGEMRSIMVVANVPEEKVGSVYLKQRAEVVFDAYRNTVLSGAVVKIDPQINPEKRTFKAYIRIEDPKLKLTPGLSAYARLEHKRKALTIPRLAMIKNADEATVFVVETSRARLRRIKTGAELLHKVEVLSGLKEGEEVVYYGLLGLKDNDLVNVETLARTE